MHFYRPSWRRNARLCFSDPPVPAISNFYQPERSRLSRGSGSTDYDSDAGMPPEQYPAALPLTRPLRLAGAIPSHPLTIAQSCGNSKKSGAAPTIKPFIKTIIHPANV